MVLKRRSFLAASLGAAAAVPFRSVVARPLLALTQGVGDLAARTLSGRDTLLAKADVEALAASLRGSLLVPASPGYDEVRKLWNGLFDKRPALIARCASPSDVMLAVSFARDHGVLTAVRCGGHSLSGKSSCDGGIMIDCSPMQSVRVDPIERTARIEGGALLAHLDRETKAFGLATTAGTVSHTGAAGLTLGGGLGRLGRRFGLACDNLIGADIVTADARLVHASESDNAELLWGLRGGGGNFGVVTSLEYRLHRMDPMVFGGRVIWPLEQARDVLRLYADVSSTAPDELHLDVGAGEHPKLSNGGIGIECCWSSEHAKGEQLLRPLRAFGKPLIDTVGPMPYLALQTSSDAILAHGIRSYAKAGFLSEWTDAFIDTIADILRSARGRFGVTFAQGGGAIGRIRRDATAFWNRDARYWVAVTARWRDPTENTEARIAEVRSAWNRLEPFMSGFYVNALPADDPRKVDENYGANYARLVQLKNKYDPANLFRLNANIKPTVNG